LKVSETFGYFVQILELHSPCRLASNRHKTSYFPWQKIKIRLLQSFGENIIEKKLIYGYISMYKNCYLCFVKLCSFFIYIYHFIHMYICKHACLLLQLFLSWVECQSDEPCLYEIDCKSVHGGLLRQVSHPFWDSNFIRLGYRYAQSRTKFPMVRLMFYDDLLHCKSTCLDWISSLTMLAFWNCVILCNLYSLHGPTNYQVFFTLCTV